MNNVIRIGTRDSELALWQANHVKDLLAKNGFESVIVPVKSDGDLILDKPLHELGITGVFTKTLDVAMLNGTVDIAVHSMKDVPMQIPTKLEISVITERENPLDALISKNGEKLADLPHGATIGTSSLRRSSQLLKYREDFKIHPLPLGIKCIVDSILVIV